MTSRRSISTRRNGKPCSCEPCRISKIRCDHKTPVCDRCVVRQKENSCVYHPAPMTKPRDRLQSGRSKRRSLGSSGLGAVPTRVNPLRESISSSSTTRTVPCAETQFFGSTAFPAIISDDQNVVDRYLGQLPAQELSSSADHLHHQDKYSEKQISEGTKVLNLLFEFPGFADSICKYLELSYTCMVPHPFIKACIESIQETMQRSRGNRLRQLVVTLFANTAKPLDAFTTVPAKAYHTLFTGPNIRWEIIGFVLAILGVSLKYDVNKRTKPSATSQSDQKLDFIHRLAEGVDYCTAVCNNCNCVSPQALWLLYGNACLKNLVYGDMSKCSRLTRYCITESPG